jgi:MGT family glycosyltransferase
MPTTLFFNVPAHGHINPSLPLVTELVQRGHHITYVASEAFRTAIEATGAVFHPYASIHDDFFEANGLDGRHPQKVARALITTTEAILPEVLALAQQIQPDYLMYDGMCPWGSVAARILRLPAVVSLSLLPFNSPPPSALFKNDMLSIVLSMVLTDFDKGLEANRRAQALAKQYNIKPLGPTEILNATGDLAISYTSAYFQPYPNTVSTTVRFIGRRLNDAPVNPTFSFEHVGGRRLIYVSLGTINNNDIGFFKNCIDALAGTDNFVIMSTGKRVSPDAFGDLPANIAIYPWVPQLDVLRRASLFITHSGLGSVHDGLYFGVPLLLIPQQGEQRIIANRVVELGAGLLLKKQQTTAEALRANATRLLSEPNFKTQAIRIGDSFRAAGGATKGADEIETLLRQYSIKST